MRSWIILLTALLVWQSADAQTFERRYFDHDNLQRTFLIYVPSTYDPQAAEEVPIVFVFHGINATDENIAGVGMNQYAEEENFIVVYPQAATAEFGFIAWNCGTLLATNIDDTGFWNNLLDDLMGEFNIDYKRVYVSGFSMGGMMSYRLACEYGDRIAAMASVSGPITTAIYQNCEPVRKMPVLHFHGLADDTVPYSGNGLLGLKGAMASMQWWAIRNDCAEEFNTYAVPDTADEWYHVDRLEWPDCTDPYEVIHYRIENWPHSWPGPSRNIFATDEIVKFFMRHELRESDIVTPVAEQEWTGPTPSPNPFRESLDLSVLANAGVESWSVYNTAGRLMDSGNQGLIVPTADWPAGIYLLRVVTPDRTGTMQLVKQ